MNRRGVLYDVGRVLGIDWRPVFDRPTVRRELQVIRDDLHCNAVKLCGRDLDRLVAAAEEALSLGLEVWFSPELWDRPVPETLEHIARAAAEAEELRSRGSVVFSVATEATLFVRGIVPGRTFPQRLKHIREGDVGPFVSSAVARARAAFQGPITYAALPFEAVDWSLLDFVSVDHYRDRRSEPSYVDRLQRLQTHGKPVVVTEFGMRTYKGADTDGRLGLGVTDWRSVALHTLPVIGRFVRPRLIGPFERDETLQATRIAEDLAILDEAGVEGAFVCTFVEPLSTYDPDPRYDLDMGALSLVKSYPDRHWEPKESFHAVARFYGGPTGYTSQHDRSPG